MISSVFLFALPAAFGQGSMLFAGFLLAAFSVLNALTIFQKDFGDTSDEIDQMALELVTRRGVERLTVSSFGAQVEWSQFLVVGTKVALPSNPFALLPKTALQLWIEISAKRVQKLLYVQGAYDITTSIILGILIGPLNADLFVIFIFFFLNVTVGSKFVYGTLGLRVDPSVIQEYLQGVPEGKHSLAQLIAYFEANPKDAKSLGWKAREFEKYRVIASQ
jgi:hypothetical protein